jgi:adenosylhomocysteinase
MSINANFSQLLSWTRRHMPRTRRTLAALPDLSGIRLAASMHLDIKIVPLIEGLQERGAEIFLVTCNPATVRDEVAAHLKANGAQVRAWRGMPPDEYEQAIRTALDWGPTHLCELGADLSAALSMEPSEGLAPSRGSARVRAGLEGTGSGISRIKKIDPPYSVFNWDDLPVKEGLHNRHMVGLSTWQTFFNRTLLSLHEKQVVVIGYGLVGQGVAQTARAYGGAVTVVERDPGRALQAAYDGWQVATLAQALPGANVVVTCTGGRNVLVAEHFRWLEDGVFLLNVGHEAGEIDLAALYAHAHRQVMPFIEEIDLPGRTVYLFAGGSMANLTAGEGDSLNAFDLTVAVLAAGIGFIVSEGESYPPGVHLLPRHVWEPVIS